MKTFFVVAALTFLSGAAAQGVVDGLTYRADLTAPNLPTASRVSFGLSLPAAFPRAARTVQSTFECRQGLKLGAGLTLAEATLLFKRYAISGTTAPFSATLGHLSLSCPSGKLKVTMPGLIASQTYPVGTESLGLTLNGLSRPATVADLIFSKNRAGMAIRSGFSAWTFDLQGGKLRVLGGGHGAVSFWQGGAPAPLYLEGAFDRTVPVDLTRPFSVAFTEDQGATWQNATVDLGRESLTFWGSLKQAGVNPPPPGR